MASARSKSKTGKPLSNDPQQAIDAARITGFSGAGGRFEVLAVDGMGGDGEAKKRTFKGTLYTGGIFSQWWGNAIIDLAGLEIPKQRVPALKDHGFMMSGNPRLGYTISVDKSGGKVEIEGEFLGNDAAREVIRDADDGYPWELSIRTTNTEVEFLDRNMKASVNGREVTGPLLIARKSILREATLCEVGADPYTQFQMAASAALISPAPKGYAMTTANGAVLAASEDDTTEEMVPKSKINAEYIRDEFPEVAKAIEDGKVDPEKKPGEGEEPVTDTNASTKAAGGGAAATLNELEAMAAPLSSGKSDWVVKAMRSGFSAAQAATDLNQMLALELKATSEKLADATTKLEAALKGGGADPLKQPSAAQLREAGGGGPAAEGFAGAAGKDPAADWRASEELRNHWKGHGGKAAFDGFARQQIKCGESYLVHLQD